MADDSPPSTAGSQVVLANERARRAAPGVRRGGDEIIAGEPGTGCCGRVHGPGPETPGEAGRPHPGGEPERRPLLGGRIGAALPRRPETGGCTCECIGPAVAGLWRARVHPAHAPRRSVCPGDRGKRRCVPRWGAEAARGGPQGWARACIGTEFSARIPWRARARAPRPRGAESRASAGPRCALALALTMMSRRPPGQVPSSS